MNPPRQGALKQGPVCAMRVGGSAKDLIRELDVNVLTNGAVLADADQSIRETLCTA